jgi:hypothetical protein
MDDELCYKVVMVVVQLQATFSVVAPGSTTIQRGSNATRRGILEQRLHTRCSTTCLWCVLRTLLRVLRFATIAVLPTLNTNPLDALSNLYDAL